jgi:hypothetical protein
MQYGERFYPERRYRISINVADNSDWYDIRKMPESLVKPPR